MRTSASSSVSNTVGVSRRQVRAVHVVDRVRQLARDAEALRRAEARAVLDVAVLLAVEPVHRRDLVRVLADAGDDRGGADGRHRRERGDAVGDVAPVAASSRSSTGAAPAAIARSSIAGAIASITHRTSLGGEELTAGASAAQDAQPGVLFIAARAPAPGEPREQRDGDVAERMQQRDQRGQQQRGGVEVDRQRLARGAVGQARARARRSPASTRAGRARREQQPAEQARPPGVAVGGERAGEQQRAGAEAEPGQRRGERVAALAALRAGRAIGASPSRICSA